MICNSAERRWSQILVLDDDPEKWTTSLIGVNIAGGFDMLAKADGRADQVVNLVARTTSGRAAVRSRIQSFGVPFTQLIHPGVDTYRAELPEDVIVYQNATIGPEVKLGEGCVVFMGAVVGHECTAADNCVIASNSVLNARVKLGERVYVGTNATILPEITVGDDATVGAGSVVIRDLATGDTAIGVPAESLSSITSFGGTRNITPRSPMAPGKLTDLTHEVWCRLLGMDDVETTENFFDLGGNSLLAIKMLDEVGRLIDIPPTITDAFRFPTISTLVAHLTGTSTACQSDGNSRAEVRKRMLNRRRDER